MEKRGEREREREREKRETVWKKEEENISLKPHYKGGEEGGLSLSLFSKDGEEKRDRKTFVLRERESEACTGGCWTTLCHPLTFFPLYFYVKTLVVAFSCVFATAKTYDRRPLARNLISCIFKRTHNLFTISYN